MTLWDKVRGCEIRKSLNVVPPLRISELSATFFGHVARMPWGILARQVLLAVLQILGVRAWTFKWEKNVFMNGSIIECPRNKFIFVIHGVQIDTAYLTLTLFFRNMVFYIAHRLIQHQKEWKHNIEEKSHYLSEHLQRVTKISRLFCKAHFPHFGWLQTLHNFTVTSEQHVLEFSCQRHLFSFYKMCSCVWDSVGFRCWGACGPGLVGGPMCGYKIFR